MSSSKTKMSSNYSKEVVCGGPDWTRIELMIYELLEHSPAIKSYTGRFIIAY